MANKKDKCIVLNKSFTGEWLNQSDNNIAHEIINFFRADDENVYIYNTPYGANVKGSDNLDIKYLFLTSSKSNGIYYLEYCIEIKQSLHHCTIGKNQDKSKIQDIVKSGKADINTSIQKDYKKVEYGGVSIEKLFNDPNDIVFPFTYLAKKIWKAKTPIEIDEDNIVCKEGKKYNFARNFGYVNKSEQKNYYKYLMSKSPRVLKKKWVECKLEKFEKLDTSNPNGKSKIASLTKDTFLDLIDNFKMEECYTKILYHLMESNPNFTELLLKTALNVTIENGFVPDTEVSKEGYGRIDLFAKAKNTIVIIENKIDCWFTMKDGVSQLKRYYEWATNDDEIKNLRNKYYIILAPDYRKDEIKAEEKRLRQKEKFDKYVVVPYSKVFKVIDNCCNGEGFSQFKFEKHLNDVKMLFLRMSMSKKDLYVAKLTKRIDEIV